MFVLILSILVAFSLTFFCSLMEASLLSMTPGQLATMEGMHPKTAALWRRFKTEIERPITAILILNTTGQIIGVTIAGSQYQEVFGHRFIAFFSVFITYLMLQFAEVLPKTLGVRFNLSLAPWFARPLSALITFFDPLHRLIHAVNGPFIFGPKSPRGAGAKQEISALAGIARMYNVIGSQEEKIIKGAARLSETTVSAAMIPVDQITFLYADQSLTNALLTAHTDPHTRFPICESNNRDKVLGYVNFKEIVHRVRTNPADPSLRGIIRPIHFASPNETCDKLLRTFVEEHVHMAVVRDSGGKTLGLVTLEDIVEELVGEIEDEFDRLPRMCHLLSGGTWMVGGGFPIATLSQTAGMAITEAGGSVSSWLIRKIGRVPKTGEVFHFDGVEWMIRRTRRGKIFEIMATRDDAMNR